MASGTRPTGPRRSTAPRSDADASSPDVHRPAGASGRQAVSSSVIKAAYDELAEFGAPGSSRVTEFMAVKERGSVQHLASTVEARLPAPLTCWDALAALFPAVTASGIPKAAAYSWIGRLEGEERGLYAGAGIVADSRLEREAEEGPAPPTCPAELAFPASPAASP